MGLVYDNQKFIRKIIQQGMRGCSRFQPCKMSGVILNSRTKSRFPHHLYVKIRSLGDSLCFEQLIIALEIVDAFFEFLFNGFCRPLYLFLRHYIMGCREDGDMLQPALNLPGQHIDFRNPVDFIPEKFDSYRTILIIGRNYFHHISIYPECSSLKIHLISGILHIDQFLQHFIPVFFHARS